MEHIRIKYTTPVGGENILGNVRILLTEADNDTVTITMTREMLNDIISLGQKQGLDISLEK